MMMNNILSIGGVPAFDNRITKLEVHTYNPYINSALGNSDEIRLNVQQQDLYLLLCRSYLYIEGRLDSVNAGDTVHLENNFVSFLFDEIRYELNGVEIDRCRNPGITTTLKNFLCLSTEKSRTLDNAGWRYPADDDDGGEGDGSRKKKIKRGAPLDFNFCVPLSMLLGFCEDYNRIMINARHELILIRARTDANAIHGPAGLNYNLTLHKVQWRIPHVTLDEVHKLSMLRVLENGTPIKMSFRSSELHEYPLLQTTTKHTWAVKATTQMEKPRYVIFALQTARKNDLSKRASIFDHCDLSNIRLYLNSEMYPYDDLNIDFGKNKHALLYDMYAKFRESFYGGGEPLLDLTDFLAYGPFIMLDCS